MIKHHGMWSSDSFWMYITSLGVASTPVAAGLARVVQATSTPSTPTPSYHSMSHTTTPTSPLLLNHQKVCYYNVDGPLSRLLEYQVHNCQCSFCCFTYIGILHWLKKSSWIHWLIYTGNPGTSILNVLSYGDHMAYPVADLPINS